eukprot:803395-Prymnesium_polylepis.1
MRHLRGPRLPAGIEAKAAQPIFAFILCHGAPSFTVFSLITSLPTSGPGTYRAFHVELRG